MNLIAGSGFGLVSLIAYAFLILLHVSPSYANDFTVDTTSDTVDAVPGDTACADGNGQCSLRAAIMEANALGGAHTIALSATTYFITIPPAPPHPMFESPDDNVGDFDIVTDITITGATRDTTIIDGSHLARIFKLTDLRDLNTGAVIRSGKLTLSKMTLQNGLGTLSVVGVTLLSSGGAIRAGPVAPVGGTQLSLTDVAVKDSDTPRTGGGIYTAVPTEMTDVLVTGTRQSPPAPA